MQAQGPASIELISGDRVLCHFGKVRTRVPRELRGFAWTCPTDVSPILSTEMGVNVERDGRVRVAVFEGLAEASLNLPDQDGTHHRSHRRHRAVEMLPGTGQMKPSGMNDFLSATELSLPSLTMRADYAKAIHTARPAHYWRLDRADQGLVPDEIPSGVALRMGSGVSLQADRRQQMAAHFDGQKSGTGLSLVEPLTLPRKGWAVELWFVSSTADQSPSLASLALGVDDPLHAMIVEYNTIIPSVEMRRSVRFLMRWPAESHIGVNLFSSPPSCPYQWHHVVAQQQDEKMELWVDGRLSGRRASAILCRMRFAAIYPLVPPPSWHPSPAMIPSKPPGSTDVWRRSPSIIAFSRWEVRRHAAIGGKE